jgi:hypothetical protein
MLLSKLVYPTVGFFIELIYPIDHYNHTVNRYLYHPRTLRLAKRMWQHYVLFKICVGCTTIHLDLHSIISILETLTEVMYSSFAFVSYFVLMIFSRAIILVSMDTYGIGNQILPYDMICFAEGLRLTEKITIVIVQVSHVAFKLF